MNTISCQALSSRINLCKYCFTEITITKHKNTFCSKNCSASYNNKKRGKHSEETKLKIKIGVNKFIQKNSSKPITEIIGPFTKIQKNVCKKTGRIFFHKNYRKYHPAVWDSKEQYWYACKFRFSLSDYPELFSKFSGLIKENGWYSTPGKNKDGEFNPSGVSRDHLVSVSYGFENNIDPAIISHPCNCSVKLHTENQRKRHKCEITLEELLERIKEWHR